jgi:hypothetical protein
MRGEARSLGFFVALILTPAVAGAQKPSEEAPVLVLPAEPAGTPPDVAVNVTVNEGGAAASAAEEEVPPAPSPGTHFLLEAGAGVLFGGGFGGEGSLMLGAGGRLGGTPFRFYLVGEMAYAAMSGTGSIEGTRYVDERRWLDLDFGLRMIIPIVGPLRVFFDLMGGATLAHAGLEREGHTPLESTDWEPMMAASAGFQARIFEPLSVGLRVKVRFTDDGLDALRDQLGFTRDVPVSIDGTVTWHF